MKSSLKFLTLNCWGIPLRTPGKSRRFRAIADALKNSDWDVVALQEVWLKADREVLIQNSGFEFHATFESDKSFLSSGMLLLSRHQILKKDFQPFIVRGFPHRLHEMDFHSTKGVGYALLDTPIGEVPVFLTHLIAKYVPRHESDHNRLFRMAQILEFVFFIRKMATPKGFILCGDLNISEEELEFETICGLLGIPRVALPKLRSEKKCLDYILCGATLDKIDYKLSQLKFVFKDAIPGTKIPYSDHLGVSATIKKTEMPSHSTSTRSVLVRTFRYMKYSAVLVNQVDKWIHWIPIVNIISRYFMQPQLKYIENLLSKLETDLKGVDSRHPLRLE